jgi:hypothetical protein
MVRFNKKGFVIEVDTGGNPIEEWLATHEEMIDVLQSEKEGDVSPIRMHYLELLRQMMPDYHTAKKMAE